MSVLTKLTHEQDLERRAILGVSGTEARDYTSFKGATLERLTVLVAKGYLDPEDYQNNSPTVEAFMTFMREHSDMRGLTAHGYIISRDRKDVRISLEGLEHTDTRLAQQKAFLLGMNGADDLNEFRAWWD